MTSKKRSQAKPGRKHDRRECERPAVNTELGRELAPDIERPHREARKSGVRSRDRCPGPGTS